LFKSVVTRPLLQHALQFHVRGEPAEEGPDSSKEQSQPPCSFPDIHGCIPLPNYEVTANRSLWG
jgi:hypothetical protein